MAIKGNADREVDGETRYEVACNKWIADRSKWRKFGRPVCSGIIEDDNLYIFHEYTYMVSANPGPWK